METVLGIDLGTQSIKLIFYDYKAKKIVSHSSAPLTVHRKDDGSAEQSVEQWLTALKTCFLKTPKEVRETATAIGVSGQQHGLVALNEKNEPIHPVKLWCDTSTQREVDEIHNACGGNEKILDLAGNSILVGYTAPKIRWLKNNIPELYDTLRYILLPHDYINYVLTGQKVMEYGDASGTGMLDIRNRKWSPELLKAVDSETRIEEYLPSFASVDEFIGLTNHEFSIEYGIPEGTPVSAGGGDNMMAAIGTGNVTPGNLTMSLGSSGTVFAFSDKPVIDPKGHIAAFCSSTDGWLPLICTMNCTLGTELFRTSLGINLEDFENVIAKSEIGAGGIVTLPFFSGERTPNLPHAKGCLLGLTSENMAAGNILRSQIEAATYGLKFGLNELKTLGMTFNKLVLTGGGSNSALWRQIVSDVCELEITVLAQNEGAAFGAALQSLWVLLKETDPDLTIDAVTSEHLTKNFSACTSPVCDNFSTYRDGYQKYLEAVDFASALYFEPGTST